MNTGEFKNTDSHRQQPAEKISTMQPGLFDLGERCEQRLGERPRNLERVVDWEQFRPALEKMRHEKCKSNAGLKPFGMLQMFRVGGGPRQRNSRKADVAVGNGGIPVNGKISP